MKLGMALTHLRRQATQKSLPVLARTNTRKPLVGFWEGNMNERLLPGAKALTTRVKFHFAARKAGLQVNFTCNPLIKPDLASFARTLQ